MRLTLRSMFLLGLSVIPLTVSAAVDIVREGRPLATVVLAQDASAQLTDAAQLLVDCVAQSTGARLPIAQQAPDAASAIYICGSARAEAFGIHQDGLDDDGFDIAFPDDSSIVIAGPTDYGTEYGVCEFLERYVGVRWLLPGPDGTDIPSHETLSVEPVAVRQAPAFFSRLFSGLRGSVQAQWARRNRMHGRISFHHNLINLFPPETYTASHPEFFPVKTPGQDRFLPPTNKTHGWQPCFTAPGLVEEAIRNINRYFDENPQATSYSLGTNDSSGYCTCDECMARITGEKNFLGLVDYSDLFYDWAGQVIEGVLQKHPDKYFGCLAYSQVAAPPKNVDVHPRLIPYMTYDRMKWIDPELRSAGERATKDWHAKSPTMGWYDYIYGTPYVLPRVWFHHMADYYRFGHANGVRALYAEAYPNWGEGPKLYVSLKLQWDPSQDVDAILDEWYERCVGKQAAPYLAKYYAHWEDFWTRRILDSKWFSKGGQYLSFSNPGYLSDIALDEIKQSRRWLDLTVENAQTPKQKARAKLLRDAFEYYEATAYAYNADGVPQEQPITTVELALKVIEASERAVDFVVKRRRLATEVFPNDPVLVHPLPMTRSSLLAGNSWGAGSLWRVYDMAAKSDGPVRQKLRELASTSASRLARGQAALMVRLIDSDLEPLTQNASFEQGDGTAAQAWSWWVKFGVGKMLRTDEVAHTGSYSVLCDGMRRGGPVQGLPMTPGTYAGVCFVYVPEGQQSKGTAELSLTLRDEKGVNLPSVSSKIIAPPGQWTAVAVAAEVPQKMGDKQVKSMLPIMIVDGFEPGETIYLDDLMVFKIQD